MNKKINVLFDATSVIDGILDRRGNGIFFASYNILISLAKSEELNVILFCESKRINDLKEAAKLDKNLANLSLAKFSLIDSLIAYRYEIREQKDFIHQFQKIILTPVKIIKLIKNKLNLNKEYEKVFSDIDVFFSSFQAIPPEVKNIKRIKKYTILYDIIPMILDEYSNDFKRGKGWFYKLYKSINKQDKYFAISEFTKQDFLKNVPNLNPENITVIPLSTGNKYEQITDNSKIDAIKEKYNIPKDKKYVFSLCTLEPRKNLIFAVKNFIEFVKRKNIDDFIFVLGGGQWDTFINKLNETIKDLDKYKDKIVKIGYVDDEDMSALYSGAEMFAFPSLYEGFGMPVLEAMYCGCPVITSNLTSMPEVIGDCGIQVNPQNDEELINAFEKMYFDSEFKKECSKKGLERAKLFTWENCAKIITERILK